MTTWEERYSSEIWNLHATLPETATLADRKRALKQLRNDLGVSVTSHGRKSWAKARLKYLARFGYVSPHKPSPQETPLERMIRRAS